MKSCESAELPYEWNMTITVYKKFLEEVKSLKNGSKLKSEMDSFKSNENIHKKEYGSR